MVALQRLQKALLCRPHVPSLVLEAPAGEGWIHEIKFVGYRTMLSVDRGGAARQPISQWSVRSMAEESSLGPKAASCSSERN